MNKEELYRMWEEEFYDKHSDHEIMESQDFESVAIGFFAAKGLDPEQAFDMYQFCIQKGKF